MATTDFAEKGSRTENAVLDLSAPSTWHKSAPKTVRGGIVEDGATDLWAHWVHYLRGRKRPPRDGDGECAHPKKNDHPDEVPIEGVLQWLAEAAHGEPDAHDALEAVAFGHRLPELAGALGPEVWRELLEHLLATVDETSGLSLEENPLVHQLLAGELAATLAHYLPEITPCRKLGRGARRALSAGLIELNDGRGFLHARHLPLLGPLMACWTRCRVLSEVAGRKCWNAAAENQYRWLVRTQLRLTRHDGSQVFGPPKSGPDGLIETALRLAGDEDDRQLAVLVLPNRRKRKKKRVSTFALPEPAIHSEWAAAAVLRREWSRRSERICVAYPGRTVRTEMSAGRDVLWSGEWELAVQFDGQPATPTCDWQAVCWVTDDDMDYLELQIDLTANLRVQRHILLARDDRFLLLADSVMGNQPGRIDYCGRIPLAEGIDFRPAEETREGFLFGAKRRALVMPLALPEWRIDPRGGHLSRTESGLDLIQSAEGRGLMAPLFFDLAPRRMTRPLTWRRLTVAESLEPVSDDVAVGYRVAVGRAQWLIYRSLVAPANRTVLGQNLSTEMLVARFRRNGETENLVELE